MLAVECREPFGNRNGQLIQNKGDLCLTKIPSACVFIAFQLARVGRSRRLLTVKISRRLFNFSAGWSFGEAQVSRYESGIRRPHSARRLNSSWLARGSGKKSSTPRFFRDSRGTKALTPGGAGAKPPPAAPAPKLLLMYGRSLIMHRQRCVACLCKSEPAARI